MHASRRERMCLLKARGPSNRPVDRRRCKGLQDWETDREITLYRFGYGESCILTANAILSSKSFPAIATVEADAEAVMIPADVFRDWVGRYDLWRDFVFNLLSDRLATVLAVVDEVVFKRMDRRVAALLLRKSQEEPILRITHQEIAVELGSSREVISRILEDLARQGLVKPGRGTLEVLGFRRAKIDFNCVTLSQTIHIKSPKIGVSITSDLFSIGDFKMKRNMSNLDRILRVVLAACSPTSTLVESSPAHLASCSFFSAPSSC